MPELKPRILTGSEIARAYKRKCDAGPDLYEALTKCRDKFAGYVELHRAKMRDGTPTQEWLAANEKAERNQAMVRFCDAALAKARHEEIDDASCPND